MASTIKFESREIKVCDILPNEGQVKDVPQNPRFIRAEKFEALKRSIQEDPDMLGLHEIIVYPFEGKYIAIGGNQRTAALSDLGIMSVKCKVLDPSTPADVVRRLILKDNYGYGENDQAILHNDWAEYLGEIEDMSMDDILAFDSHDDQEVEDNVNDVLPNDVNPYEQNVTSPIYSPSGECPPLESLFDTSRVIPLLERIDKSSIPDEIKNFLRVASWRHAKINFKFVAEYYCHASKEVQELFEDNALVVIDFNKAIENGFAVLRKDILDIYNKNNALNAGETHDHTVEENEDIDAL